MKKNTTFNPFATYRGLRKRIFFIPTRHGSVAALLCGPDNDTAAGKKRFTVICSHGFGIDNRMVEHGRMFLRIAERLAKKHISTLMFSYPGMAESDGLFADVSPNQRIETLRDVIAWFSRNRLGSYGVLGMSMGAAVAIHALSGMKSHRAMFLATLNAVPSFNHKDKSYHQWHSMSPKPELVIEVSNKFLRQNPKESFASAYASLNIPKLHIQSGEDIPHFAEEFEKIFKSDVKNQQKQWIDIPGADHVFSKVIHRKILLSSVEKWINKFR